MIQVGIDFGMENIKVSTCTDGRTIRPVNLDSRQGAAATSRNVVFYQKEDDGEIHSYFFGSREVERSVLLPDYIQHIKQELQKETWEKTVCNGEKTLTAEDVTTDILSQVYKLITINRTGEEVQAVMTVPVNFSEYQKKKLLTSAEHAGFHIVDVLTEPMASLFSLDIMDDITDCEEEKNVVVFDFGGSTLDICLVTISQHGDKTRIENIASTGMQFGGVDISKGIIEQIVKPHFQKEIKEEIEASEKDIRSIDAKLYEEMEKVKMELYNSDAEEDDTTELYFSGEKLEFSRQVFNDFLIQNGIDRKIRQLFELLFDSIDDIEIDEVDEVFMIGGTSQITFFKELICDIFDNDDIINTDILGDETNLYNSVANGAANFMTCLENFDIIRKTSMSIGIDRGNGYEICLNKNVTYAEKGGAKAISTEFLEKHQWKLRLYQSVSDALAYGKKYPLDHPDICFAGIIGLNSELYKKDRDIYIEVSRTPQSTIIDTFQLTDKKDRQYIEKIDLMRR